MARVQHTCTGCVPIDAAIIEVYIQLLGLKDSTNEAAERAEQAAEYAIGKSPYIGDNGNWWEWDDDESRFIDTGVRAQGSIAVDDVLSTTSTNPVQNKVITNALGQKQNAISDLQQIRTGAGKGETAYQKPQNGIPASDIAAGVIPDISGKQDTIQDLSAIRAGAAAGASAAVRPYDTQSPDGMGYLVLEKDATFASQVTDENTIYEIRYDFSLDNVVSLPLGCKLVFNGGSLNLNGARIADTRIDALSGGMIPNLQSFANYNAERLVALINAGFSVEINDPYYIGVSATSIAHNVELSGKGKLIKTTSAASFEISAAISIHLFGLSLIGDYPAGNEVFSILFSVPLETHILMDSVIVENCSIDNVRVYSHIGDDVDQTTTKDGVKSCIFRNNIIKNIGYYCARLDNCLTDYVEISDNKISNFRTIVFSIATNNNYQALSFRRSKMVVITGNYIDNKEYVMAAGATATYHTPFVVEADICVFNNNTIKNIICTATGVQVGVYAGYLSAGDVEMRGNYILNVINLGDSTLNECFKSKGGSGSARKRVICGNTYVVSSDIVSGYTSSIMFFSLQGSDSCDLLNISDNTVEIPDLDFAWGAGTSIVYDNAYFCRNYVICKSIASNAREMFRLSANPNLNGEIYVAGNRLICKNLTSIATTLLKEASGYKCTFEDNEMYGFVSFGQYETNYENLEIVSRNNKWILSGNTSSDTIRAYNVSCVDDEIILSASPHIRLYPNLVSNFRHKFFLPKSLAGSFVIDWSGNNSKGLYKITIENAMGVASVRCRADDETVTILNDAGTVITCSRILTESSQSISIPLTQTIPLGSLTTTGKQVTLIINSTYFSGFPTTVFVEKVSIVPNANAFANRNSLSQAEDLISGIRPYMAWKNSRLGYVMNGRFYGANGLRDGALSGATADRPAMASADKGFIFFDTTLGKSIVWNGSAWVNMDGTALS